MKQIITDELWHVIQNCIPTQKTKVGRPHTDYRQALNGIAYVLRNGIYWHHMPKEFGKPSTIHGIFMKWTRAGIVRHPRPRRWLDECGRLKGDWLNSFC